MLNKILNLFLGKKQRFIRIDYRKKISDGYGSLNIINISDKPDIIRKIYEHFNDAKVVYYYFFDISDWKSFDEFTFYSNKLKSWCRLSYPNGMFTEFTVARTNTRYDIHYDTDLQQVPEFYEQLDNLYKKHKEEYLKDLNL